MRETARMALCDGDGWEYAAAEWVAFVRSDDALYPYNVSRFLSLLPAPSGLTIDVGCGEGRLVRTLKESGYRVVGVDASPTLVRLAGEADPGGDYRVAMAEALPFADDSARLVVSFMTLEHVADLQAACSEARRVLSAGGSFCLSLVHPARSGGSFDSIDQDARFVLDAYFPARAVKRPLFDAEVVAYHRPLSDYADALSEAGFVIGRIAELPSQRRAVGRLPMFMHIAALAPS